MISTEWLETRKTGIGASEAAAAIGVSPWASPMQLWGEKTGQIEPDDLGQIERVQWGTTLQPIIAEEFRRRTGRVVRQNRSNVLHRHRSHDFMLATLDATQRENGGRIGALEIKTTSAWNKAEWEDKPPIHYQIQLQHQLAVTGYEWGTLAVLVGGQELKWVDFERHDDFIAAMIKAEARFWQHVTDRTPPPVDGSVATAGALKRLYGQDDGETVQLPAEAIVWDEQLAEVKAEIKAAGERKMALENQIKAEIKEAAYGELPGGGRFSWKTSIRHEQAREAREVSIRTLRRLKK